MKPYSALSMERDASNNKHSVGESSGVASLLRPRRICCIMMLSIAFSALILYFLSAMDGNMASLLLKPSAFSMPSFRFGQDPCAGRYIYMYDLPPRFNADLARDCRKVSATNDMCKLMENDGFGPPLSPGDSLPEKGAYDTDQYMLGLIYHARMRRYECLTADPSAVAVYVPFYAGFDWSLNVGSAATRDALPQDLVNWLVRRPEWRAMGGRDHFLYAGRPTGEFMRNNDDGWGNALMTYPAIRNMTVLTMEASPWVGNDFAVPWPSHFHPSSDADVLRWQDRMRRVERRWLWCFAGGPRPGNTTVRSQIIEQCRNTSSCAMVASASGYHNSPDGIMRLLESAEFCLEPRGDTFTRKSTFDAILAGCIPVFFHPISAYIQYTWYLPRDYRSYSVFIPHADVENGDSIEEVLTKIPRMKVARMREEVIRLIPRVMYRDPMANGVVFKDAFDVAINAVIDRVKKRPHAAAEGRQYEDSVDGTASWKYDLLGHGKNDTGPQEFEPYM